LFKSTLEIEIEIERDRVIIGDAWRLRSKTSKLHARKPFIVRSYTTLFNLLFT